MANPYAKFSMARRELAVSHEPLRERIARAFVYIVQVYDPLPHDVAKKLSDFEAAWAAVGDTGGETRMAVWARQLTDKEAIRVAGWLMDAAAELQAAMLDDVRQSSVSSV